MKKISSEEQARRAGILYGLSIAREKGLEGIQDEIRYRNITKAPLCISREDVEMFAGPSRDRTIDTVLVNSLLTLHDEFGMNKKRLERFKKQFLELTDRYMCGPCDTDFSKIEELRERMVSLSIALDGMDIVEKQKNEEYMRISGLEYAEKIVRESGLDALVDDVRYRGISREKLNTNVTENDIEEFVNRTKTMYLDIVLCIVVISLNMVFGYGKKNIERFSKRFWFKGDCISEEYATWQMFLDILEEECNMKLDIRYTDDELGEVENERVQS